jgi:hypothetical protein
VKLDEISLANLTSNATFYSINDLLKMSQAYFSACVDLESHINVRFSDIGGFKDTEDPSLIVIRKPAESSLVKHYTRISC